jgi:hypothetical protein
LPGPIAPSRPTGQPNPHRHHPLSRRQLLQRPALRPPKPKPPSTSPAPSSPTAPAQPRHNLPRQHHKPVILFTLRNEGSVAKDPTSTPPHQPTTRTNSQAPPLPSHNPQRIPLQHKPPNPTTPRQPLHRHRKPDANRAPQPATPTPSTSTTTIASSSTANPGNLIRKCRGRLQPVTPPPTQILSPLSATLTKNPGGGRTTILEIGNQTTSTRRGTIHRARLRLCEPLMQVPYVIGLCTFAESALLM